MEYNGSMNYIAIPCKGPTLDEDACLEEASHVWHISDPPMVRLCMRLPPCIVLCCSLAPDHLLLSTCKLRTCPLGSIKGAAGNLLHFIPSRLCLSVYSRRFWKVQAADRSSGGASVCSFWRFKGGEFSVLGNFSVESSSSESLRYAWRASISLSLPKLLQASKLFEARFEAELRANLFRSRALCRSADNSVDLALSFEEVPACPGHKALQSSSVPTALPRSSIEYRSSFSFLNILLGKLKPERYSRASLWY